MVPVDLAIMLFGNMQHLHTITDIQRCWSSISGCLKPGGILILELPHYEEVFNGQITEPMYWESSPDSQEGTVIVEWGTEDDDFDAEAQVFSVSKLGRAYVSSESADSGLSIPPSPGAIANTIACYTCTSALGETDIILVCPLLKKYGPRAVAKVSTSTNIFYRCWDGDSESVWGREAKSICKESSMFSKGSSRIRNYSVMHKLQALML